MNTERKIQAILIRPMDVVPLEEKIVNVPYRIFTFVGKVYELREYLRKANLK